MPGSCPVQATAAVWHGAGDIRVETRQLPPAPPAGWVRLRVAWCGICGSDATELLRGPVVIPTRPHPLTGTSAPLALGHEFTGHTVATGGGEPYPAGTRLVCDTLHGCGTCRGCARGEVNLCPVLAAAGLSMHGGLATIVDVPAGSCLPLPDHLPLEVAALTEPLAVAERATRSLQGDEHVVILGAGAVGTLIATLLSTTHHGTVDLVEPNPARRAFAEQVSDTPAAAALEQINLDAGRLTLIECTGHADALNTAIRQQPPSSRIILVGVHGPHTPVDLHALLHKEITLATSLSHSRDDFARALQRITHETARFAPLITTHVTLADVPEAIAALASPTAPPGKTLVHIHQPPQQPGAAIPHPGQANTPNTTATLPRKGDQ